MSKVLSIKQPWASLICTHRPDNILLGIKDIENRTWKTKFRGRILIHASAATVFDSFMPDMSTVSYWLQDNGYNWHYNNIPHSAIIGEVDIVDCVMNHSSIWAEKTEGVTDSNTGEFIPYRKPKPIWNWVLANPVLYDTPILNVKGKLSFWQYDKHSCLHDGKINAGHHADQPSWCDQCGEEL